MDKETRVQTRDICTNCTMGVVANSAWVEWSKKRDTLLERQREENWSSSQINYEADKWLEDNPHPEWDEEDSCPECEGTSVILRWIPIDEFLTECRLFFDRERNHSHPCCENKHE